MRKGQLKDATLRHRHRRRRSSARSICSSPASGVGAIAEAAAKIAGVGKVHVADDAAYAHGLAENVAPLIAELMNGHDAFLAPATTTGKNIAPRVAALLDVMQISDILSVEGDDTFTRPIYAGNAIATVRVADAKKVITVRSTAFEKAAREGGSGQVEAVSGGGDKGLSSFVGAEIAKSERPELTSAKIIVSGGRALGSARAVPRNISSRSPTSSAPRSAPRAPRSTPAMSPTTIRSARPARWSRPKLYVAIGISGAIQHLAGHEGFEDHRRHQQGRGRADLPGRRHRPGRRPVQDRARS